MKRLAARVTALRELKGLTQGTLAKKAGTTLSTVNEIEKLRITDARISTVASLADALDVGLNEFFEEPKWRASESEFKILDNAMQGLRKLATRLR